MGRMLRDGRVYLDKGLEREGVSWQGDEWQVFDNGDVIYKDSEGTKVNGLQAFGTIDNRNVFHLLPKVSGTYPDWTLMRRLNARKGARFRNAKTSEISNSPPVFNTTANLVFVKDSDIKLLHGEELRRTGSRIVMLAVPPAGPPVILPIGSLLRGGRVMLDPGIEVEGIFWESIDKKVFDNGTMVYKQTDIVEQADISYGIINNAGVITLLPKISKRKTDLRVLRSINVASTEGFNFSTTTTEQPLALPLNTFYESAWETFKSIIESATTAILSGLGKRSVVNDDAQRRAKIVSQKVRFLHSYMDVLTDIVPDDFWLERSLRQTACEALKELMIVEEEEKHLKAQCGAALLESMLASCD